MAKRKPNSDLETLKQGRTLSVKEIATRDNAKYALGGRGLGNQRYVYGNQKAKSAQLSRDDNYFYRNAPQRGREFKDITSLSESLERNGIGHAKKGRGLGVLREGYNKEFPADSILTNQQRLRKVTKGNNGKAPVARLKAVNSYMAQNKMKKPSFTKGRGLGYGRQMYGKGMGGEDTPQQFGQQMDMVRAENKKARQARRSEKSSFSGPAPASPFPAPAPPAPAPAPAPAAPEPKMITYAEQLAQAEGAAKNAKPVFAPVRPTPRLSMLPAGQARRFGSERYASAPAPPPPEPAPIETKTPEQKRAEVLAQTGDKSKVANTDVMHQRKVRDYLASRNAATGNNGNVIIPPEVVRSLRWMGYQVPEPDMAGSTLPDGTKEPGWHSKSNRLIIDDMADHLGARDLEEELRQNQSRKAQAEVAKSRQAKAEASAAPQAAAPAPPPPEPAPAAPAATPFDLGSPNRMPVTPEPGTLGSAPTNQPSAPPPTPSPPTTPTPAAQAASSATTTTAGTATPAAAPSATPATPSQAAASTASAAPTPSAAPAGAPPPRPPPPPSAGATPPPASPPPPPRPTVTTAKDAMKRGQRVQGPTGVRNRGSNIHNNSFWQRELHLSSQGLIGGLASVANDFGLNRRVASYADKKASTYTDSWFGKSLSGSGYVHPVEEAGQVIWKSAKTLDAAERGWAQHIVKTAQNSTGIMGALTKSRAFIHGTVLGGQGSMANKALTALGGAGSTIAPLMAAGFAINDARQGYREGGILGAASGAATGYLTGALVNKVISGVLLNPAAGLIGGGLLAATMYTTHKIFDVRNKGVEYLRMGRMQGLTWDKGPSPGMSGANIASMRQRSLNAMENSRFNAMKAIGNESYMMSAPKARYSNSTAINSIAPMLSY